MISIEEATELLKGFRMAVVRHRRQQSLPYYGGKLRVVSEALDEITSKILKGLIGREPTNDEIDEASR